MQIDIAVEDYAKFKVSRDDANFPYKFSFLDRTTGIIIHVSLSHKSYKELMYSLNQIACIE